MSREQKRQHHKVNQEEIFYDSIRDYQINQLDSLRPFVVFYKGVVVDNQDPLKRGRLKLKIVFFDRYVEDVDLAWYNPSIMGSMFYLPRQGDIVYVTFEDAKNRIGGMWWSYFIRENQWDWRVKQNQLLLKVKGMGADYILDMSNIPAQPRSDQNLLLINGDENMVKVHSDFIVISKKGWEEASNIPEADFLSFDGNKSKVTINAAKTFMGNVEMDLRKYFDGHIERLDASLKDITESFNSHSHAYNPGPGTSVPSGQPSKNLVPLKMDEDLVDDLKDFSEDSVEKFLTDNPVGRE